MALSLWSQAAETWSATGANAGTAGMEFSVSEACVLNGLWLYSRSGEGLTSTPTEIALYTVSGTALVTSQTPAWSGAAGSGWIYAAFSSPPSLAAGTDYMAAVYGAAASFGYDSSFSWPVTASPVTGVNGGYYSTSGSLAYPSSQQSGWNWWIDVSVTPTALTASAALTVIPSRSASASVAGQASRTAHLTVAPSLSVTTAGGTVSGSPVLDSAGNNVLDSAGIQVLDTQSPGSSAAVLAVAPSLSATAAVAGPVLRTAHLTVAPSGSASRAHVHARAASLSAAPVTSAKGARAGLVQAVHGSTTGTSLTLTFPAPVTVGDAVIVCIAGFYDGTVSSIALGTSGGAFTHSGSSGGTGGNNAGIYANFGAAQSAATLTITTSAAGILAYAYEVAGAAICLDAIEGGTGTGTSWSSGATAETIPYPHFIVGIGSVIANTGTITATGSGWTNEAAITDVVGAGSHAIGAVSGYQQAQSSGTYTYNGTSGSSSAWGAVTAAFLVVPPPAELQTGWGGYVFNEHAAAGYTGITATFTVPSLSGGEYDSVWIGMGNVYQVGIYQTYNTSDSGNAANRPWTWWLPGAGEAWNAAAFPIAAGDTLTLTMQLTAENWLMTIGNVTEDWSYTEVKSVLAVNIGSIADNGAGPAIWPYPVLTAEVIIEKETTELPDYGSLLFTEVTTTPAATRLPYPIFTAAGGIDQYPGPFNLASGSFTMNWNAYS
jgi:Domain of unknown function (DUF4082)